MYQDGKRVDRATVVVQVRATLPTLQRFEPEFRDVEVRALGSDFAVTSMTFHDTIVDADGRPTRSWGPNTMLWGRRGNGWQIEFVDADHYPVHTGQ